MTSEQKDVITLSSNGDVSSSATDTDSSDDRALRVSGAGVKRAPVKRATVPARGKRRESRSVVRGIPLSRAVVRSRKKIPARLRKRIMKRFEEWTDNSALNPGPIHHYRNPNADTPARSTWTGPHDGTVVQHEFPMDSIAGDAELGPMVEFMRPVATAAWTAVYGAPKEPLQCTRVNLMWNAYHFADEEPSMTGPQQLHADCKSERGVVALIQLGGNDVQSPVFADEPFYTDGFAQQRYGTDWLASGLAQVSLVDGQVIAFENRIRHAKPLAGPRWVAYALFIGYALETGVEVSAEFPYYALQYARDIYDDRTVLRDHTHAVMQAYVRERDNALTQMGIATDFDAELIPADGGDVTADEKAQDDDQAERRIPATRRLLRRAQTREARRLREAHERARTITTTLV